MQQKLIDGLKEYFKVNGIKTKSQGMPTKKALEIQHAFINGAHTTGVELSPYVQICVQCGRLITDE